MDRSLGRKGVPDRLRSAGLRVITLAEHYGVRCFCLHPSHGLRVTTMADRFLDNLAVIRAGCIRPGPFFYHVQDNGIRLQRLPT